MQSLRGKRALVTGAASGIGRAIALALAKEGCDVCLFDINQQGLDDAAREIERLGQRALPLRCDLSSTEEIASAGKQLLVKWDGLEVLVNNGGVLHYGPTHLMTDDQWDRVISINLLAPIHLTRLLLPTLLSQPEAHLVNVSSMYGYIAARKTAAYHASKFGLLGLTESLRAEYGRQGIGVTAVCPGFVKSQLFESGSSSNENGQMRYPPAWACTTPEYVAQKTIRAIYRNRRLVLVTPLAYGAYYLKRFAPWLLDWAQHWGQSSATRQRLESIENGHNAEMPRPDKIAA